MRVSDCLEGIEVATVEGDVDKDLGQPQIDSRKITAGGTFIAIRGTVTDGHKFIENAIQNGATTVVCEELPVQRSSDLTWIEVTDSAMAAGVIAHCFYGRPSGKLLLTGVTGTNGKTTTVVLLYNLLSALGVSTGLLSTIGCRIGKEVREATHTTPDPISLNRMLALMVSAGCTHAFMEVSSHAIDQKRIAGLQFAGAVFTNITHDHLDYHGTFRRYLDTKKKLFDGLSARAFALVNSDDPRSEYMVQNTVAKVSKYSLHRVADFRAKVLGSGIEGLHMRIQDIEVMSPLAGEFNAHNLLTAYAVASLLGFPDERVLTALSGLRPVEGRFDIVRVHGSGKSAIVDYAHTPDALRKVLGTLHHIRSGRMKILVVVGCGGDRDKAKRPKMAAIAAGMADTVILTSDNPRSEDPEAILAEMMSGVQKDVRNKVLVISDRREAIRTAVRIAADKDIILIAGKGHEKYQEIQGVKHPFDDKMIVRDALVEDI